MKSKKGVVSLVGIVSFSFVLGISGVAKNYFTSSSPSEKERKYYQAAKKEKERLSTKTTYNPKAPIKKEEIEKKAENVASMFNMKKMDAEEVIQQNSIEKKALYLAAEDMRITVSDKEVTEEINKIKGTFDSDPEGQKELNAQVAGMGMNEDEYWESLRPQYKSNMIVNKYLQKMYEGRCEKENIDINTKEFMQKRQEWRNEIVKEAIKKYKVKVQP